MGMINSRCVDSFEIDGRSIIEIAPMIELHSWIDVLGRYSGFWTEAGVNYAVPVGLRFDAIGVEYFFGQYSPSVGPGVFWELGYATAGCNYNVAIPPAGYSGMAKDGAGVSAMRFPYFPSITKWSLKDVFFAAGKYPIFYAGGCVAAGVIKLFGYERI